MTAPAAKAQSATVEIHVDALPDAGRASPPVPPVAGPGGGVAGDTKVGGTVVAAGAVVTGGDVDDVVDELVPGVVVGVVGGVVGGVAVVDVVVVEEPEPGTDVLDVLDVDVLVDAGIVVVEVLVVVDVLVVVEVLVVVVVLVVVDVLVVDVLVVLVVVDVVVVVGGRSGARATTCRFLPVGETTIVASSITPPSAVSVVPTAVMAHGAGGGDRIRLNWIRPPSGSSAVSVWVSTMAPASMVTTASAGVNRATSLRSQVTPPRIGVRTWSTVPAGKLSAVRECGASIAMIAAITANKRPD